MDNMDIVEICEKVLDSLVIMASDDNNEDYEGQLIFPNKIQKGKGVKRINKLKK
jgi:hypothetical protein